MADEKGCREFLKQGEITGVEDKSGKYIRFQIRRAGRYENMIKRLYTLFTNNHISWQVVHMGKLCKNRDDPSLEYTKNSS